MAERFEQRVAEEGKRPGCRIMKEVSLLEARVGEMGRRLAARIDELGEQLEARINAMGKRLEERIDEMEKRLDHSIMEMQAALDRWYAGLVRWMFIFWAGQIGVIVALFALLR